MKVIALEPLGIAQEVLQRGLEDALDKQAEVICHETRAEDAETLRARAADADVLVVSNIPLGRDVLAACPNLKMICVAFTGTDHIDTAYCEEKKILVCNCAGYSTAAVADLVFGFAVALTRNILPCGEAVRRGKTKDGLVGWELEGKTFGIVGIGAIGQRTARIAAAFGCRVLAYSRTPKDIPDVRFVSLDALLAQSDIVSLHVPLSEETRGMIGGRELALMKPSAYLINTARGPVVDSHALADALERGVIRGAAADVFETEPPIAQDHPLLRAPNIILTPHIAFASQQAFEKRAKIVFQNLRAWKAGAPQNVIVG